MSVSVINPLSVRCRIRHLVSASLLLGLSGCGLFGHEKAPPVPKLASAETLYNNGIDALRTRRYTLAAAEFEVLQQNYPYSGYVANAQLMEGYSYYLKGKYPEAVQQLNRFIGLHPTSADAAYAYYLRALCFYEQIADVQRDQQGTVESMDALEEVITRFPQSKYARDAQLKIDLCRDHLAGKEMLVGRYYQQERNYEAAINRYQRVVEDFQTTNHVPEALERMVEVYLDLGLTDQARKSGIVLGYNYPGSKWYRFAYSNLKRYKLLSDNFPVPGKLITAPKASAATTTPPTAAGAAPAPSALGQQPGAAQPMDIQKAPVAPVKAEPAPPDQARVL
ncbi:outer membrane protein assembly factor BamD [Acetobacter senegalensis]|uniref:outer membrane protein assembly factor BamD n=1 Tax=Acetobacter senegalensis TaxID=446692 RepID=UPI001EDDCCE8|nr:outer membrane protein assembly factor BamD [Acetobacter senegalensis]MCG4273296.1 outer membrane protein assembly factor BamD [Acetobacter senegalensis]MDN7353865.1 outer membrane protein assembly factor BamD [Acetobacter senegalensis]